MTCLMMEMATRGFMVSVPDVDDGATGADVTPPVAMMEPMPEVTSDRTSERGSAAGAWTIAGAAVATATLVGAGVAIFGITTGGMIGRLVDARVDRREERQRVSRDHLRLVHAVDDAASVQIIGERRVEVVRQLERREPRVRHALHDDLRGDCRVERPGRSSR